MDIAYAAGGAIAALGGVGLMFRWLNAKTDKKQDIRMCDERSGHIKESLEEIKKSQETILKEIRIRNGTH